MAKDEKTPDAAPTETFAKPAPTYRVDHSAGKAVRVVGEEETPLADNDTAPAEIWAELRGHVDPKPDIIRDAQGRARVAPRRPIADYQAWKYEVAKVHWGGTPEQWAPGAIGKEMTLSEYDAFVKKGLEAQGTGSGIPPKKDGKK